MRCPLVPYPAPLSSPFENDTDATSGIPAAMNSSASARERRRVTKPSRPKAPHTPC